MTAVTAEGALKSGRTNNQLSDDSTDRECTYPCTCVVRQAFHSMKLPCNAPTALATALDPGVEPEAVQQQVQPEAVQQQEQEQEHQQEEQQRGPHAEQQWQPEQEQPGQEQQLPLASYGTMFRKAAARGVAGALEDLPPQELHVELSVLESAFATGRYGSKLDQQGEHSGGLDYAPAGEVAAGAGTVEAAWEAVASTAALEMAVEDAAGTDEQIGVLVSSASANATLEGPEAEVLPTAAAGVQGLEAEANATQGRAVESTTAVAQMNVVEDSGSGVPVKPAVVPAALQSAVSADEETSMAPATPAATPTAAAAAGMLETSAAAESAAARAVHAARDRKPTAVSALQLNTNEGRHLGANNSLSQLQMSPYSPSDKVLDWPRVSAAAVLVGGGGSTMIPRRLCGVRAAEPVGVAAGYAAGVIGEALPPPAAVAVAAAPHPTQRHPSHSSSSAVQSPLSLSEGSTNPSGDPHAGPTVLPLSPALYGGVSAASGPVPVHEASTASPVPYEDRSWNVWAAAEVFALDGRWRSPRRSDESKSVGASADGSGGSGDGDGDGGSGCYDSHGTIAITASPFNQQRPVVDHPLAPLLGHPLCAEERARCFLRRVHPTGATTRLLAAATAMTWSRGSSGGSGGQGLSAADSKAATSATAFATTPNGLHLAPPKQQHPAYKYGDGRDGGGVREGHVSVGGTGQSGGPPPLSAATKVEGSDMAEWPPLPPPSSSSRNEIAFGTNKPLVVPHTDGISAVHGVIPAAPRPTWPSWVAAACSSSGPAVPATVTATSAGSGSGQSGRTTFSGGAPPNASVSPWPPPSAHLRSTGPPPPSPPLLRMLRLSPAEASNRVTSTSSYASSILRPAYTPPAAAALATITAITAANHLPSSKPLSPLQYSSCASPPLHHHMPSSPRSGRVTQQPGACAALGSSALHRILPNVISLSRNRGSQSQSGSSAAVRAPLSALMDAAGGPQALGGHIFTNSVS